MEPTQEPAAAENDSRTLNSGPEQRPDVQDEFPTNLPGACAHREVRISSPPLATYWICGHRWIVHRLSSEP
eukprot:scaffold250603_cov35-Tisochrysis_lutea.AAC.3